MPKEKTLERLGIIDKGVELKDTKLKHEEGISGAAYDRGLSFLAAAQLILDNTDRNVDEQKAFVENMQLLWAQDKDDGKTFEQKDLAALERLLIIQLHEGVYPDLNKDKWKKVKDELDNAENHINWFNRESIGRTPQREPITTETNFDNIKTHRVEEPISAFTQAQEAEWLDILDTKATKILDKPKPGWFAALPEWEQKCLQKQVEKWQSQKEDGEKNLGKFLGAVPTTIRRYPGSPNAYQTKVEIERPDGSKITFSKIRSGVLAPVKMKANSTSKKQRKVEITKQNLEQLIVEAIKAKVASAPGDNSSLEFPILLQTLFSPPLQPPGAYNNEALQKAVDLMREELGSEEKVGQFIATHQIDMKSHLVGKIDLLYTNQPVNKVRGISQLLAKFSKIGRENSNTLSGLSRVLEQVESDPNNKSPQLVMARQAMDTLNSTNISTVKSLGALKSSSHNALAERAALLQIITDSVGGVRVGSCVSGKDREEMVTEIAIAQMQFYSKHGEFPPKHNPSSQKDKDLRNEFVEMIARQYLNGHGQELAGENSMGCDGLKNVQDVFGSVVCDKIKALAASEYGIDPSVFDPVKDVQRMAGLNKLSVKKLDVDTQALANRASNVDDRKSDLIEVAQTLATTLKNAAGGQSQTKGENKSKGMFSAFSLSKKLDGQQALQQLSGELGRFVEYSKKSGDSSVKVAEQMLKIIDSYDDKTNSSSFKEAAKEARETVVVMMRDKAEPKAEVEPDSPPEPERVRRKTF